MRIIERTLDTPKLSAPIPGQSLTDEPRGYAWERPPEISTAEEALDLYLPRVTSKPVMEDILTALDNGFPLTALVKSIYMNGVMDGKHSIDVGLLIAPILHELILAKARSFGINVREVSVSPEERQAKKDTEEAEATVQRQLEIASRARLSEDESSEESMVTRDKGAENVPDKPEKEEIEEEEKPSGKGLMSRRV